MPSWQGGEDGHAAGALAARLVIDPQLPITLQAVEGLLRLPAPLVSWKAEQLLVPTIAAAMP